MKRISFVLIMVCLLSSCTNGSMKDSFAVITWNMYLFFDYRDDGYEYAGFTQKDGYTQSVYEKRMKDTALMMAKSFASSDVIILEEVESNLVLNDLLEAGLKRKGFRYYGVASNGETATSVGFISKYSPMDVNVHGLDGHRLLLEISFDINGAVITIIAIHATSKLDGGEDKRFEEFSLLRDIAMRNAGNIVLLAGDFNADPRVPEKGISDINSRYRDISPIVVTGDPGITGDNVFFSQAIDYMNDIGKGTYLYGGEWFFYDNILVSKEGFDNSSWEYSFSEILSPYETIDLNGSPLKFSTSTCKGMSDHLPLKCVLKYY